MQLQAAHFSLLKLQDFGFCSRLHFRKGISPGVTMLVIPSSTDRTYHLLEWKTKRGVKLTAICGRNTMGSTKMCCYRLLASPGGTMPTCLEMEQSPWPWMTMGPLEVQAKWVLFVCSLSNLFLTRQNYFFCFSLHTNNDLILRHLPKAKCPPGKICPWSGRCRCWTVLSNYSFKASLSLWSSSNLEIFNGQ